MLPFFVVALAVIYMAWNIGASDVANYLSAAIGTRALGLKKGMALGAIFGFAGALLLSRPVVNTIAFNIIPQQQQTIAGGLVIILSAAFLLTLASYKGLPISTTQAIRGAILGFGLAKASAVNWSTIILIATSWIVAPIAGIGLGFVFYWLIRHTLIKKTRGLLQREGAERKFAMWQIISATTLIFVFAANDIAGAFGIFLAVEVPNFLMIQILACIAFAIGILTFGARIIETMTRRMLTREMTPARGFAAQLAGIVIVLFFNQIAGIPLSTTQVAVTTIMGAGLVGGLKKLNWRIIGEILTSWLLILPLSAALTFVLTAIFL